MNIFNPGYRMNGFKWWLRPPLIQLLTIISLCLFPVVHTQVLYGDELLINEGDTKRFADFLYRNREYYRAISEYKRLIHFFPNSQHLEYSVFQIGRSYMAGGDWDSAIIYWNQLLNESKSKTGDFSKIHLLLAISHLDKDHLKPFQLREPHIKKALEHLDLVAPSSSYAEQARSFASDWRNRPEPEYKSPWVAGTLSAIIPGSGSYYAERHREGTYAFFITALFYIAALEAYHKEENELALIFGSFTLAFYGGGIYTAVNGVHKLNDRINTDALHDIRKSNGFWFVPETSQRKGKF